MSNSSCPVPGPPHDTSEELAIGCGQAALGLLVGGFAGIVLMGSDPFGVMCVPIVDGQVTEVHWGIGRFLGLVATLSIPFLMSGLCGVFAHKSLPASMPGALLRMAGVASSLLVVLWLGSEVLVKTLSTGESSDIMPGLASLALGVLCIALAAPFSSAVIRRRSSQP